METLFVIERGCPNCEGPVDSARLEKGLVCGSCISSEISSSEICKALKENGKLKQLKDYCSISLKTEQFCSFFEQAMGSPPSSLQKLWAKRVLKGISFSALAPTGLGKSTFGYIMGLFLDGKALFILPTKILAQQTKERLHSFSIKTGKNKRIILYESSPVIKEQLSRGDFDILIGTNMFFQKNAELLRRFRFSFIFIDDIDSFLKQTRNLSKLFTVMGFSEEDIKKAFKTPLMKRPPYNTVVVVSSATANPKPNASRLFRNLLGFDIQKSVLTLRNIVDTAVKVSSLKEALIKSVDIIKKMGPGGLVFLAGLYKKQTIDEVVEFYKNQNIKVISYSQQKPEQLYDELKGADFDIVVGLCHQGNPLVRGIDLPHIIKYCIFLDIPQFVFSLELSNKPLHLYTILVNIFRVLPEEIKTTAINHISYLKKYLFLEEKAVEKSSALLKRTEQIKKFIKEYLDKPEFLDRLSSSDDITLKIEDSHISLIVADAGSYIQASGRASRLVGGKLTKGLSVLFYTDTKALLSLKRRLATNFYHTEVEFSDIEDINLLEIKKQIDADREYAAEYLKGRIRISTKDFYKTVLVIVESPNKAKTIANFFGKPHFRTMPSVVCYELPASDKHIIITASLGHIIDLVTDRGFFGVESTNNHFIPYYDTIKTCPSTGQHHTDIQYLKARCPDEVEDKIQLLHSLRELATEVDEIFIATDPDAEGEKIAYDLFLFLKPFNLNIFRAEFHEVTPRAFIAALNNPRGFNLNLVKAQLVRRILDRWVGFTLSRLLWQRFRNNTLSAGRVQTPVLGWIIHRQEQHKQKIAELRFRINGFPFKIRIEDIELAKKLYLNINNASITLTDHSETQLSPPAPYRTDTLLQDAADKLNLSADKTMQLLQELFEAGLITYHRTDSVRVSETGQFKIAKTFITEQFGHELFHPRKWSEHGAHECIRPTRVIEPETLRLMVTTGAIGINPTTTELYELIFKRFMASQMTDAVVKTASLIIKLNGFSTQEQVIIDLIKDGFNIVYPTFSLCPIKEPLHIKPEMIRYVPKSPLFTEGSLISEMKRKGIGRPSTYAQIIKTLYERGYIINQKSRLIPTKTGTDVYTYLSKNYGSYISEELTRELEQTMDNIEQANVDYITVLREIYKIKQLLPEVSQ